MDGLLSGIASLQDRVSRNLEINPSTLSGAIDVIVVQQEDGSLKSTPFHIRWAALNPQHRGANGRLASPPQRPPHACDPQIW